MDAASRLKAIAWLYLIVGAHGLVEQVVTLVHPFESVFELHLRLGFDLTFNAGVLALPLGIGLLYRKGLARKVAVGIGWLFLIWVAVGLASLFFYLVFFKVTLVAAEAAPTGEEIARWIGVLLVDLPLFVWQFRELRSHDVRGLFAAGATAA